MYIDFFCHLLPFPGVKCVLESILTCCLLHLYYLQYAPVGSISSFEWSIKWLDVTFVALFALLLYLSSTFGAFFQVEARKYGLIDQVKYKKRASKLKFTEREYHVKDDNDVAHKYVKMFCNKTQFPSFPFFVYTRHHMVSEDWVSIIICDLIQN